MFCGGIFAGGQLVILHNFLDGGPAEGVPFKWWLLKTQARILNAGEL